MKMETSKTVKTECPVCKYSMDRATGDGTPSKDDVAICINCLAINQFNEDLTLRIMDVEAYAEIRNDEKTWGEIERYRQAIRETKTMSQQTK